MSDNPDSFDELEAEIQAEADSPDPLATAVAIYAYSQLSRRWFNTVSGQLVSQATVVNEMRRHVAGTFETLNGITSQYYSGSITLEQWQIAVASELKDAHLAESMFAVGGKHNMTAVEYGRVGGTLADEYRFLAGFADDIAAGRVSEAQALDRVRQYGKATQQSFWREWSLTRPGLIEWRLHPAEHCGDCVELAAGSPYTAETLPTEPGAGDTQCRGNCNCTLEDVA